MASMGVYVFSRQILLDMLERESGDDFGRELIPGALARYTVKPYLYRGYWADVGTIESFYEANVMLCRPGAPFRFYDPQQPIYTHLRHLPGSRLTDCHIRSSIIDDGCYLEQCTVEESVIGIRTIVRSGARITRSVLLGADYYAARRQRQRRARHRPRRRPRSRHHGQERAHRRRLATGQRAGHRSPRRRRVLHPQRHHHRAEERGHSARHTGIAPHSSYRPALPTAKLSRNQRVAPSASGDGAHADRQGHEEKGRARGARPTRNPAGPKGPALRLPRTERRRRVTSRCAPAAPAASAASPRTALPDTALSRIMLPVDRVALIQVQAEARPGTAAAGCGRC